MSRYNWEEIKVKYETGKYSMRELAQEYGFNRKYGSRKASENNWEKGKSSKEVDKKAVKRAFGDTVDKEVKLRKEYEKLINNTRRGAYNALMKEKDFNRLKQFKIFSEILRNCRREQWEVNEILETAQKAEFENQEDRLEEFINTVNKVAE